MDTTAIVIAIIVAVVVIVALLLLARAAKRKREQQKMLLRERFGPEYDRAVQETGSEKKAQSKLAGVASTRDKLEIRPLEPAQRDRYETDWMSVQAAFVDAPDAAVRDADRLVRSVMRDRGYPVDDFDSQADMVAIDHPHVAENYRAASAIRKRTSEGTGYDTDDLRQAFVHYRALFAELLSDDSGGRHAGGDTQAQGGMARGEQMDLTQGDRTAQEPPQR
jgi:hypothetical protein